MNESLNKGSISSSLTSGIIITLALMVGLTASTDSKAVVIGAVAIIALASAFADGLAIHLDRQAGRTKTSQEVWSATIAGFSAKFILAASFVLPIIFFELMTALIINIFWGMALLTGLSYFIALENNRSIWKSVSEHLTVAFVVTIIVKYLIDFINLNISN